MRLKFFFALKPTLWSNRSTVREILMNIVQTSLLSSNFPWKSTVFCPEFPHFCQLIGPQAPKALLHLRLQSLWAGTWRGNSGADAQASNAGFRTENLGGFLSPARVGLVYIRLGFTMFIIVKKCVY